jgi:site-specific DNA recombinase
MNFEGNSGPTDQMHCASYLRSASDMAGQASLVDQELQCRKFAEAHGWIIPDDYVYHDANTSGTSLAGRYGLNSLISDAEKRPGPFQMVLTEDTSRLGRNLKDVLDIVNALAHHNVHFYFINQKLDSRDEHFRMMLNLSGTLDEQYIARFSEKVRRGQMGRVLSGLASGGRCLGYQSVPLETLPTKGSKERVTVLGTGLEVFDSEAETIRRIYKMYAGGLSVRKIVNVLNAEKVPATQKPQAGNGSGSWNRNLVSRVLQNERYIGTVVWNRTKRHRNPRTWRIERWRKSNCEHLRVPTPHLRIVTDELWNRVQDRLKRVNGRVKGYRLGGLKPCP